MQYCIVIKNIENFENGIQGFRSSAQHVKDNVGKKVRKFTFYVLDKAFDGISLSFGSRRVAMTNNPPVAVTQ